MRISAGLVDVIAKSDPDETINIIIKARVIEPGLIEEIIQQPGAKIRHVIKIANTLAVSMPVNSIERIVYEPWVERIEEDQKIFAVLDESVASVGAQDIWESGFSGAGVKIAIIDTGIDEEHADFSGRIVAVRDFTLEAFKDKNGHGTHVAGIVAGSGEKSNGKYRGIAPGALIIAGKALGQDGTGFMSDVMAAIEWSVELGADIINLSLGTCCPSDGDDLLCEFCNTIVDSGCIIIASAGNDGPKKRSVGSPGAARSVLTVGATTPTGLVADFSSRGPTGEQRMKPEVVAPGIDIVSVRAKGTRAGKPVNNHYTSATGTSMAAPHVSGLVALLLEANREASPQLIREALLHTAEDLTLDDCTQGAGVIVGAVALSYIKTHENPPQPLAPAPTRSACMSLLAGMFDTHQDTGREGNRLNRMRRKRKDRAVFDFDNFDELIDTKKDANPIQNKEERM